MILRKLNNIRRQYDNNIFRMFIRNSTVGFTDFQQEELTSEIKHGIERHWRNKLNSKKFDPTNAKDKFYVLSMFPYPSGNLHMGHVRVYAISDALARFYRMIGKNVLHPMGWDAFGLPAENAANQRNIPADVWTKQNIAQMKEQLIDLGCSFDWDRELATCDPLYYKWTQSLFLKLFNAGLAYQKEALVNWDPVDKTVLADEQVDENGHSWRSGAKVEKKALRQWFIKTTKFSKALFDGLKDPILVDWKDIINLQQHWLGECNGYSFDLTVDNNDKVNVWTRTPEYFESAAFIAVTKDHILNRNKISQGFLDVRVENPFNGKLLPVIVTDTVKYPLHCDTYLGLPLANEFDKEFAIRHNIAIEHIVITDDLEQLRKKILTKAQSQNIGGYAVSSKLQDWLISRQRNWGTPIPIIHCEVCGAVPVNESDLPVILSDKNTNQLKTTCPKCQNSNAYRESDTMDTFVDSSWYFLRYLDSKNDSEMFDKSLAKLMPVDLYIGGKEHAVLHLYYARFINHFLHSIGLVPEPEPFKRLLVQGMVMGRSFCVKGTGKYLKESDVKIVNAKKDQAVELSSGKSVVMKWEKMSKSKLNGVEPSDVISEHSCDSVRLIILGDVAPTSHRNWSNATFPGILGWQKRLWLTVNEFHKIRCDDSISKVLTNGDSFAEHDAIMFDARNYYIKGTTFSYKFGHHLSVAITKMQGLTNSIRRAPKEIIKYSGEYEETLASLIIMLAPMAPHFTSELWSNFTRVPNRINRSTKIINWDLDVLEQSWPKIDATYTLDLKFRVNGVDIGVTKFTQDKLKEIDLKLAVQYALKNHEVKENVGDRKIERSNYAFYPECWGVLNLFLEKRTKVKNVVEQ